MECVDNTDGSTLINDRYTHGALSSANQGLYFSPFPTFTPVTLSQTYSHGGITKTISGDMNFVSFKTNIYTRNHASGGYGLLDIIGFPRVDFNAE